MNLKPLLFTFVLMLSIANTSAQSTTTNSVDTVTKAQVDKFMKINRSNLLLTYHCPTNDKTNSCTVVCSSGGAKFIETKNVQHAYYAERLKKLDGALAGFFLIVDVDNNLDQQDIWATLQTESSCYFKGMTPAFK